MAPPAPPKYQPLADYLAAVPAETVTVTLTLPEVEALLGSPLPPSAGTLSWWANTAGPPHARAWLAAGWHVAACALRSQPSAITVARGPGVPRAMRRWPMAASRPPRDPGLRRAVAGAGLLLVGGLLSAGLPGALIFEVTVRALFGPAALDNAHFPADRLWPAVIMVSLLWPAGIVAGYVVGFLLLRLRRRALRVGVLLACWLGWGVALSLYFYLTGRTG